MPAVSKAQQRFMGMVHAADKGETPASPEVAKVSKDMKDSDAKDFASTKHDGLPDHVKEQLKSVVREVIREKNGMNEMSSNDVHFKHIMKMYDRGGSFTKKKIGAVVCKDPKASRKDVEEVLFDSDYRDITQFEDELGLTEIREKYSSVNEEFKHVIHVDTPTQVVSKPIAAQIMALAKKGVRASEIGLEMGFVGNAKLAADTFQKVKNQIYFALDKRNESVEEGLSKDAVVRTLASDKNAYFLTKDGNGWILDITPKAAQQSTFHQKFDVKDLGKGHLGMKYKLSESVNEAMGNDKSMLALVDMLSNSMEHYSTESEFATVASKIAGFAKLKSLFKDVYNKYWDLGARERNDWHTKDWLNWLKKWSLEESVSEVTYPTDLKVGSVILGQGFTMLKGIEGGKYYKVVSMDDTTATLTPSDKNGNTKGSSKVRHKLDSIESGIKTAKRGDENGIVVIKESVNEEHDCGCNEVHDCGCGGLHEHHINEDINADANGIAGLTASRANAVKDFIEKNNINSNKLYLSLKKGNLKDRMDFVTALVGKPGNPIQTKVIKQFSN
jgi:hypothetical protein